jgi:hypothetical protein
MFFCQGKGQKAKGKGQRAKGRGQKNKTLNRAYLSHASTRHEPFLP